MIGTSKYKYILKRVPMMKKHICIMLKLTLKLQSEISKIMPAEPLNYLSNKFGWYRGRPFAPVKGLFFMLNFSK